jgi:hypothetical protein
MTFSLDYYSEMLTNLQAAGRTPVTVADAIGMSPDAASSHVVLRHDVDRLPPRSRAMARLEARLHVRATYYFRCRKDGRFPFDAIKAIADLGHEVGYHYETLSQFAGDRQAAVEAFARNLARFRTVAECQTISMHGAPLSKFDNQDLLEHLNLAELSLRGDAVRDLQHLNPVYFTDTGGGWNSGGHRNRRDVAGDITKQAPDFLQAEATSTFCREIDGLLYLNTHAERWPSTGAGQFQVAVTDGLANSLKRAVLLRR